MNHRVRWHDANSNAEPELRAVIRYTREHGPSEAEIAALTSRVSAELSREPTKTAPPRVATNVAAPSRALRALLAAHGLVLGLLLWQSQRESHEPSAQRGPHSALNAAEREAPASSRATPVASEVAPAPSELPPTLEGTPKSHAAPRVAPRKSVRKPPAAVATTSVPALPEDELSLLFRARRIVVADPARALALTAEHAKRFPQGLFGEEREALHIEALVRRGRQVEAAARYTSFSQRYRRSAYHERLHALLDAASDASLPAH